MAEIVSYGVLMIKSYESAGALFEALQGVIVPYGGRFEENRLCWVVRVFGILCINVIKKNARRVLQ